MKQIYSRTFCMLVITTLFLLSCQLFAQWNIQNTFTPAQSLQVIRFYDANTGYTTAPVYGGSMMEIHKTTNAGVNWTDQNAGYTGERFMAIWIIHPDTVYISGNTGHILKTVNGGSNWVTLTTNTTEQLWGLQFTNSFTGYAAGSNGLIIKTTDAGATWSPQVSAVPNALSCVYFRNPNTGYVSGSSIILKTTNAGATWATLSAPYISFENIRQITFTSDLTGFAVSDAGRMLKTTNAGTNWALIPSGTSESLFGIFFTDTNTAYACGNNGAIIKTTNAGNNWSVQTSPAVEILTSIYFTSANTGYISTWYSKVLKTTNGGVVFTEQISNEVPKSFELKQNYPNPFNPGTNIDFAVPVQNNGSKRVLLKVYDATGSEVATLVNEDLGPGTYRVTWNASENSSGIYFYALSVNDFKQTRKMVLIK